MGLRPVCVVFYYFCMPLVVCHLVGWWLIGWRFKPCPQFILYLFYFVSIYLSTVSIIYLFFFYLRFMYCLFASRDTGWLGRPAKWPRPEPHAATQDSKYSSFFLVLMASMQIFMLFVYLAP